MAAHSKPVITYRQMHTSMHLVQPPHIQHSMWRDLSKLTQPDSAAKHIIHSQHCPKQETSKHTARCLYAYSLDILLKLNHLDKPCIKPPLHMNRATPPPPPPTHTHTHHHHSPAHCASSAQGADHTPHRMRVSHPCTTPGWLL